jgi:hypothetical protein
MLSMKNAANHYYTMFIIMIISGGLSTMNIWVDNYADIRFSLNDLYMIFLMGGWMLLFMGIIDRKMNIILLGLTLVGFTIWSIRTQFLVTDDQYLLGMLPHHSMAVHMSKKLLAKKINNNNNNNNNISPFLENIINNQQNEIIFMKEYLSNQS